METWYVMVDGTSGDPGEIGPDDKGLLRHKDGRAVAYTEHGPRSRSLDPDEERARAKPKAAQPAAPVAEARDMKPADDKRPYTTRDVKSR